MNKPTPAPPATTPPSAPAVAAAPAPKAAAPAVDPRLRAIREDRLQQAKVSTRFDASRFRRKEYDSAGNPVPPRTRRAP